MATLISISELQIVGQVRAHYYLALRQFLSQFWLSFRDNCGQISRFKETQARIKSLQQIQDWLIKYERKKLNHSTA